MMMKNTPLKDIQQVIEKARRITLVSHRRPDGDTLGACLALHFFLKALGKKTTLACVDNPSSRFSFLPDIERYQRNFLFDIQDLIIVCDAGDSKMTGYHELIPDFLSNNIPILNIDHHASNNYFGKYNFIDPTASSATVLVYEFAKAFGFPLTKDSGLCLLTGIYNDTGGFMHSNTDLRTFRVAAEVTKHDVDASLIARYLFREKPVTQLRLWGLALERLRKNEESIVSSILTVRDIKSCGATSDDTGGVIDLMNTAAGAKFSVLVAEDERGFVKGSFRTQRDEVDVASIALQFGGGGHKKAAGFRIPGRLREEKVWKIVREE